LACAAELAFIVCTSPFVSQLTTKGEADPALAVGTVCFGGRPRRFGAAAATG